MKILVTGANGYIGLHIVKTLLDKGIQVIACDLNTDEVDKRAERKNIDLFTLPDTNIYTLLGTPDVCLHLAWRNGFVHNASTHLGDLSAHYRFLTRIIDDGLPQLAVMGTMHEIGYWEGAIDENTPNKKAVFYSGYGDIIFSAMIKRTTPFSASYSSRTKKEEKHFHSLREKTNTTLLPWTSWRK